MNSRIKRMDLTSIFEAIEMIEDTKAMTIERVGFVAKLTINADIIDEDEEKRHDLRTEYLHRLIFSMGLEVNFFDFLKSKNTSLKKFIEHYSNIYCLSVSSKKIDEYTERVLGKEYKKACINVGLINPESYRPAMLLISHRSDYDCNTKKMYSEDEVLRLVESRDIIVRYNPVYRDYQEEGNCFICGLEDCIDLDNEKVVSFTLRHYPFIYQELRTSMTDSIIDKDKISYIEDRKKGIEDIMHYYAVVKDRHIQKAKNLGDIEGMCLKKLLMLNKPNN